MINWTGFVPAAALVLLIRGASQLLGLSNAARYRLLRAVAGICAQLAAFVLFIGLVVAGLGTFLSASSGTLTVAKWVGVTYLAWLGFTDLRRARYTTAVACSPAVRGGVCAPVRNEFVVAISNPKAVLLFASLLPQFASGEAPVRRLSSACSAPRTSLSSSSSIWDTSECAPRSGRSRVWCVLPRPRGAARRGRGRSRVTVEARRTSGF